MRGVAWTQADRIDTIIVMVTSRDKLILWLLIGFAAFLVVDDIWRLAFAEGAILPKRIEAHTDIVSGGLAPYRYRILVPYLVNVLIVNLSHYVGNGLAFLLSYATYFFAAIATLLVSLYLYLRLWLDDKSALIGCLIAAFTMPVGLRYFYPYSFLEVTLFIIALYLIYRHADGWLLPLVLIASLNRETAIFIVVAYAIHRRKLPMSLALGLAWLGVFVVLRLWLGDAPRSVTVADIWAENTSPRGIYEGALNSLIFFGVLWFAAIRHYPQAASFLKQMAIVGLLYIITILAFGRWEETRLLMMLYPIVLPLALQTLNPND